MKILRIIGIILFIGGIYMALHDVDYNNDTRDMPAPSVHDTASERKADGTSAITNKVGTSTGAYINTKDASIVVNDGTTNVVQLGALGNTGTFGLKVAKPGFDVTSTSSANLIFNSGQNVFKIAMSGYGDLPQVVVSGGTGGGGTFILTHNLGYVPAVLAFVEEIGSGVFYPIPGRGMGWTNVGGYVNYLADWRVEITSDKAYFFWQAAGNATYGPFRIKYYVLQETASQ